MSFARYAFWVARRTAKSTSAGVHFLRVVVPQLAVVLLSLLLMSLSLLLISLLLWWPIYCPCETGLSTKAPSLTVRSFEKPWQSWQHQQWRTPTRSPHRPPTAHTYSVHVDRECCVLDARGAETAPRLMERRVDQRGHFALSLSHCP